MSLWVAWPAGAGLLVSLALGMAFSLMETTMLRLNRLRLVQLFAAEHAEPTTEREIFREAKEVYYASRLGLCTTLVLAGFCLQAVLSAVFAAWMPAAGDNYATLAPFALALIALPPLYLFFVYAVPRLLLRQETIESEADLPFWMRPFLSLARLLAIPARVFAFLPLQRLFFHQKLTKSDIMTLVTDLEMEEEKPENAASGEPAGGEEIGEEETDEEEFIYNILDLEETLVREVMKPINTVVAVRIGTTTTEELRDLSRRTGYSRFPVYRDRIVNLAGYVSIYDVLKSDDPARALESFVTPVYAVPEFMRVNNLLREFRERGEEVAVVVDEYGGCSGWVTREDALEEIVGEIEDEFDRRARRIRKHEDGAWLIDGSADVDDVTEEAQIEIEEGPYDTLAGFVLARLERMPIPGDTVKTEKAVFIVERMEGYRIAEVRVIPAASETNDMKNGA